MTEPQDLNDCSIFFYLIVHKLINAKKKDLEKQGDNHHLKRKNTSHAPHRTRGKRDPKAAKDFALDDSYWINNHSHKA